MKNMTPMMSNKPTAVERYPPTRLRSAHAMKATVRHSRLPMKMPLNPHLTSMKLVSTPMVVETAPKRLIVVWTSPRT